MIKVGELVDKEMLSARQFGSIFYLIVEESIVFSSVIDDQGQLVFVLKTRFI